LTAISAAWALTAVPRRAAAPAKSFFIVVVPKFEIEFGVYLQGPSLSVAGVSHCLGMMPVSE
jgi:hypothetical protein